MKRKIGAGLVRPPQLLGRPDLFLTVTPLLGWLGLILVRDRWMGLHCSKAPTTCTPDSVFAWDRWIIPLVNPTADRWSFFTQDFSAYFALSVAAYFCWREARKPLAAAALATRVGLDWLLIIQAVLWNGFINEIVRLTVQRPRPFVYLDPVGYGTSPAHYTSFYSGHTSFSAACGAALFCLLLGHQASRRTLQWTAFVSASLVFATGAGRVLSARHFLTDVVFAAVAASLIALAVNLLHRR